MRSGSRVDPRVRPFRHTSPRARPPEGQAIDLVAPEVLRRRCARWRHRRKVSPPKRAIDLVVRNRRAAYIEITGFEIAYPVVKGREQPRPGKRRFPVQITAEVGQIVYAHLDILPPIPYGGLVRGGRNRPPCAGLWLHEPARLAVLRPSIEIRFSRDQSIDERRLHLIAPCLGLDRGPDLVPGGLHAIANHPLATTTSEKTTEQQHIKKPAHPAEDGGVGGTGQRESRELARRFHPPFLPCRPSDASHGKRARRRDRRINSGRSGYSARNTIAAFCPPNPRLLLKTVRTGAGRATFGT